MEIEYFKSAKAKLIFLLIEVEGEKRNRLLGITRVMYRDKATAKSWYEQQRNQLSAESTDSIDAVNHAFRKLDELYKMMTL